MECKYFTVIASLVKAMELLLLMLHNDTVKKTQISSFFRNKTLKLIRGHLKSRVLIILKPV